MTATSWWHGLNGTKKVLLAVGFLLVIGATGGVALREHVGLPSRVDQLEEANVTQAQQNNDVGHTLDRIEERQERMETRLDRVLCILEGRTQLSCELEYGGSTTDR